MNLSAAPQTFKENAFLRVADRTYFFSEVRELVSDLEVLNCLKDQSKLWQVMDISSSELAQLRKLTKNETVDAELAQSLTPVLEKVVMIYKLKHFLNLGQRVTSFSTAPHLWTKHICFGPHTLSTWCEKIEQHLRTKFGVKNASNSGSNELDMGALKDFLSSASAKYEHDYLFKK